MSVVTPAWLELREGADAAARSAELADRLARHLATGPLEVHDLGGGSGAMGRWLAPRLPGPQHWVVHDRDPDLLGLAAADAPPDVTVEARRADVTRLAPEDLAGASLVTASALLDLLTREELQALIDVCAAAGCPALLTLSVVGHVELTSADPLDGRVAAAFDAHQRRMTPRGRLLGPDAVAAAVQGFRRAGSEVLVRPSPWRLAASRAALATEWFTGWLDAACEQDPALAAEAELYARRRLAAARAGRLVVRVGHADLLALPPATRRSLR